MSNQDYGIPYEFRQLINPQLVELWNDDNSNLTEADRISVSMFRIFFRVPDIISTAETPQLDLLNEEIENIWGDALKTLQIAIVFAQKAGIDFYENYYEEDSRDPMCEALVRLHARACRITNAILVMLKAGFSDDAYARWRTLYEIQIISAFIRKFGEKTAESYLKSIWAQLYKMQKTRLRNVMLPNSGEDDITQEDVDEAKERSRNLSLSPYGWAAETLIENNITVGSSNIKNPSIHDLSDIVGLRQGQVPYLLANAQVHANPDSLYWYVGKNGVGEEENGFTYGGSKYGLLGAGTDAFQSLSGITEDLLAVRSSDPVYRVASKLFAPLWNHVNKSFHDAQEKLNELSNLSASNVSSGSSPDPSEVTSSAPKDSGDACSAGRRMD